jgi:quercetin dioxygenase-like cupin family protein
MRFSMLCFSLVLLAGAAFQPALAEDSDKPMYAAAINSKFVNFPGVPKCTMGSVQSGDPSKGGAVLLLKAATGCKIPWHWHTADEQLMMVSGRAKIDMKDGTPVTLRPGDYIALPGKGVHQFTCLASCMTFNVTAKAFDIHYVDADGKEISPDEALKTKSKMAMPMKKME